MVHVRLKEFSRCCSLCMHPVCDPPTLELRRRRHHTQTHSIKHQSIDVIRKTDAYQPSLDSQPLAHGLLSKHISKTSALSNIRIDHSRYRINRILVEKEVFLNSSLKKRAYLS